jgi:hypothetical protein
MEKDNGPGSYVIVGGWSYMCHGLKWYRRLPLARSKAPCQYQTGIIRCNSRSARCAMPVTQEKRIMSFGVALRLLFNHLRQPRAPTAVDWRMLRSFARLIGRQETGWP